MNLSYVATELSATVERHLSSPDMGTEYASEALFRSMQASANAVAYRHGFPNARAAVDAIRDRTSSRWVHFSLLGFLDGARG